MSPFDSAQGYQFDSMVNSLLSFCSACHLRQFDIPHDHVRNKYFLTPWASPAPQSPTPGA